MKKSALVILALALTIPLYAKTLKNVPLMDAGCSTKAKAMTNPDAHTRSCMMQCAKNGYGVVLNGKFVKFDEKGNELAKAAFKNSSKKDHLRATVDGEMKDGVLHVSSLKLD